MTLFSLTTVAAALSDDVVLNILFWQLCKWASSSLWHFSRLLVSVSLFINTKLCNWGDAFNSVTNFYNFYVNCRCRLHKNGLFWQKWVASSFSENKKIQLATLIWKVLIVLPFCNLREERIWQRTKVSLIRLLRIWPLSFDPREVHVNKTVGFIMHSKNIIWNLIPARAYIIKRTKYQNDDSHLRIFPWEFICKWCLKLSNLYLWKIYVNACLVFTKHIWS